ncbi:hypothetical protein K501DRAFT_282723 [Backusella circina FSU 941]|nr:hypothetical protein K501DRAFT_282723 [Backusella circina FSU 941]
MRRPPGQIDAFVSSDEGSDMDVSESETDEPTITQPFTAVAPSDYSNPSKLPEGGSFVSNMRNYAAEQAQNPSNRINTPRVEHFNNESNPIQVDSDSDNESTSSFHTAPSSPTEQDDSNDELEKEMARIKETIEMNKRTIRDIRTEVDNLQKQRDDINLQILQCKVRSSISIRKRTALREMPKPTGAQTPTQASASQPQPATSVSHAVNSTGTVDSTRSVAKQSDGIESSSISQEKQLLHHHSPPKQTINVATAAQRVIVQPSSQKQRNNTNNSILGQRNIGHTKETNLKRKVNEKQIQKDTKRLKNMEIRNVMRAEKNKDAMEINNAATELAAYMAKEKPPSTSHEAPMEEGELLGSSSTSSDDDNSHSRNGCSRSPLPIVQNTLKSLGTKTQTPSIHHTVRDITLSRKQSELTSIT